jgi:putative endonuclease
MPRKKSPHPSSRQILGTRGENMAADALRDAGYTIVALNVRVPGGQIDVLAEEGGDLVFVEVKTRRSLDFGTPAEAVDARKRSHLIAAAQTYLERQGMSDRSWRIDVVSILLLHGPPQIEILRHAIEE